MIRFIVYRQSDGLVVREGYCSDADHAGLQAQGGEQVDIAPPDNVSTAQSWYRQADGSYVVGAAPAPPYAELQAMKFAALASIAGVKLNLWEGGSAPAGGLQVDEISTGRINAWATQALIAKSTGTAFGLPYWIMADNSHHAFTSADDFLAFAEAAAAYKTAAILNNSALKAAIEAASNEADLSTIDIHGGWPS